MRVLMCCCFLFLRYETVGFFPLSFLHHSYFRCVFVRVSSIFFLSVWGAFFVFLSLLMFLSKEIAYRTTAYYLLLCSFIYELAYVCLYVFYSSSLNLINYAT